MNKAITELVRDANRYITPADRHAILDLIEQQAAEIVNLKHDIERHIANHAADLNAVAPAVDAQPAAWTSTDRLAKIRKDGEHVDTMWGESLARYGDDNVPLYASAQSEGLRKDAERYRYLRRRAVMVDYSDDTVTKLTLFKEEGPTGEFLDDWVDGALSQHKAGEKDD